MGIILSVAYRARCYCSSLTQRFSNALFIAGLYRLWYQRPAFTSLYFIDSAPAPTVVLLFALIFIVIFNGKYNEISLRKVCKVIIFSFYSCVGSFEPQLEHEATILLKKVGKVNKILRTIRCTEMASAIMNVAGISSVSSRTPYQSILH